VFLGERDGVRGIYAFGAARVPILLLSATAGLTIDDGISPYPGAGGFAVPETPLALPF
jgi:hypothetical protein